MPRLQSRGRLAIESDTEHTQYEQPAHFTASTNSISPEWQCLATAHPGAAKCNGTWVGALALAYTASKGLQLTYRCRRTALLLLLCLSHGTTGNRRLFEISR